MLIQASDLRDAVKRLDKGMESTMADYEIASIAETPIMDVFHYKTEVDENRNSPKHNPVSLNYNAMSQNSGRNKTYHGLASLRCPVSSRVQIPSRKPH